MGTFLFYIFEASLCLILLYLLFRIFFRTDTLFCINRLLLLTGTLGCTLLPFVQLDISSELPWQRPISAVRNLLVEDEILAVDRIVKVDTNIAEFHTEEATDKTNTNNNQTNGLLAMTSWSTMIGALYIAGALIVLFFFLLSTWRMSRLLRRYSGSNYNGYRLIICPEKIVSFSWWNTIVLSQTDYEKHADEILLHEQMHLRCRHTFDLLWMEVLIALHWFNPVAWLLMRDLRELHEYQADNGVLTNGIDATQYQLLLVKKSVGTRLYSMAHGFNHRQLKKRINMMLKKRTSNWARLKLLLFVPVAAGTMYAFAQPEVKETVEQLVKPVVMTQDSICVSDEEQLELYFKHKRMAALGDKDHAKSAVYAQYDFFVNMLDQMLLDNERINDAEALRTALTNMVREDYRKAVSKKKTPWVMLNVRYDRGSSFGAINNYLTVVNEVYLQLRKEIAAQSGVVDEEQLDKVFPVLVNILPHQTFGGMLTKEEAIPIEVSLSQIDGTQSKTLKDISLKELEKEIIAFKTSANNKYIQVCLKVDANMRIGTLYDVKETMRKACAVK